MPNSSNSSFSKRARSYSRPQTPTSIHSRYAPSPARNSKPKLLPFPDLPVRGVSRDASRTTSPSETPLHLSPRGSTNSSAIGLSSFAVEASGSGSGSGYFGSSEEVGSATGTASGQTSGSETGNNTPSGATTPRSPLGRPAISDSHQHVSITASSVSNRMRSQTTAGDMPHSRPDRADASGSSSTSASQRPRLASPQSILLNPIISSANPTTRIEGFHPVPVSPTATIRASSVPTNINSSAPTTSVSTATSSSFVVPPAPIPKDSPVQRKKPAPSTSGALSAALSPTAMPDALGDHLYRSFITGSCADVRIWVKKWGVGWAVHRMVLVQASFFHSMFLGGFSETGARKSKKGKEKAIFADDDDWAGEDLELQFDDPNITRAAFEVCLSRLYSPFPQLQYPVALIPTPIHPLSPCFAGDIDISYPDIIASLPPRTQLATPRLLLSLLATTIYLGHASLLREVLSLILRTIGPGTIERYLSFAVGDGIGDEEWDGQTEEGARGLEDVAKPLAPGMRDDSASSSPQKGRRARSSTDSAISTAKSDDEELKSEGPGHGLSSGRRRSKPSPLSFEPSSPLDSHATDDEALPHFYGFASDKIGEACCCFLTRWGTEILYQEAKLDEQAPLWRVFARGGIHAKFVRALLSSDSLFVSNEMDRYRAARKVLDLRRRGKEEEGDLGMSHLSMATGSEEDDSDWEDEEELEKVFTDGIYYTHMTFEDLSTIAADIDPHTGLPFAPLHVLQAAHWSAADLKSRILNAATGEREPEAALGLCKSAQELSQVSQRRRRPRASRNVTPSSEYGSSFSIGPSASISSVFNNSNSTGTANPLYYPVSSDDTYRVGAAGLLFTNTHLTAAAPILGILGMPDFGPAAAATDFYEPPPEQDSEEKPKARPPPHDERTYFGLSRQCRLLSDIISSSNIDSKGRWSKAEPFRFCVEFWNCHLLAERERMYSTTHFYAGSWFNVYVQTIRKKDKGIQLGIYLHRQHPGEPFPEPSTPDSVVGLPTSPQSAGMRGGAPLGRSLTGQVTVGSPRSDGGDQAVSDELLRKEPYRDERPLTMAYFSITCASALGTALLRFSSAPDSFTYSQSWGWKSSALRSEEYLSGSHSIEEEEDGVLGYTADMPKGGSLRASVIVGVV